MLAQTGFSQNQQPRVPLTPEPQQFEPYLASRFNELGPIPEYSRATPDQEVPQNLGNDSFDYRDLPYWRTPPLFDINNDWWLFDSKELHLELGYVALKSTDSELDGDGFAFGVHYFFSRYFSIGLDYMNGQSLPTEHFINGTLRARVPFDDGTFALNLFVGGGGVLGSSGGNAMALEIGAGLEIRLLKSVSLIADFRTIEPTRDLGSFYAVRTGFSIIF
jgi:hypothetical protein